MQPQQEKLGCKPFNARKDFLTATGTFQTKNMAPFYGWGSIIFMLQSMNGETVPR